MRKRSYTHTRSYMCPLMCKVFYLPQQHAHLQNNPSFHHTNLRLKIHSSFAGFQLRHELLNTATELRKFAEIKKGKTRSLSVCIILFICLRFHVRQFGLSNHPESIKRRIYNETVRCLPRLASLQGSRCSLRTGHSKVNRFALQQKPFHSLTVPYRLTAHSLCLRHP